MTKEIYAGILTMLTTACTQGTYIPEDPKMPVVEIEVGKEQPVEEIPTGEKDYICGKIKLEKGLYQGIINNLYFGYSTDGEDCALFTIMDGPIFVNVLDNDCDDKANLLIIGYTDQYERDVLEEKGLAGKVDNLLIKGRSLACSKNKHKGKKLEEMFLKGY